LFFRIIFLSFISIDIVILLIMIPVNCKNAGALETFPSCDKNRSASDYRRFYYSGLCTGIIHLAVTAYYGTIWLTCCGDLAEVLAKIGILKMASPYCLFLFHVAFNAPSAEFQCSVCETLSFVNVFINSVCSVFCMTLAKYSQSLSLFALYHTPNGVYSKIAPAPEFGCNEGGWNRKSMDKISDLVL